MRVSPVPVDCIVVRKKMIVFRGNVGMIIVLWIGVCELKKGKKIPHEQFLTATTEVRFFHHRKYKWPKGRLEKFCGDYGMEVLVAYNMATYTAVHKYLMKQDKYAKAGFWYGLNDRKKEGSYYNSDGSIYKAYFSWRSGEPDEADDEDCVVLQLKDGKWLFDVSCENGEYYVACSRKLGRPKVEFIEDQECRTSLDLRWTASPKSVGLKHRVKAQSLDLDDAVLVDETVIEPGPRTTKIKGLKTGKKYKLEVTVCTNLCCCGILSSSTTSDKFIGMPTEPLDVNLRQTGDKCKVSWKRPEHVTTSDLTGYRLTLASSPIHVRDLSDDSLDNQDVDEIDPRLDYVFRPKPRREYVVWVQSSTCVGFSQKAKARGTCRSGVQATSYVPNPTLLSFMEGEVLRVTFPDESAVKISCVFVLVHPLPPDERAQSSMDSAITLNDLKASSKKPPGTDGPYLAVAIPRPGAGRDFVDVTLGDEQTTKCDIAMLDEKTGLEAFFSMIQGKRYVVQGQNWKLKDEWSYSFYVVVSSSTDGQIALARSASYEISSAVLSLPVTESVIKPAEVSPTEVSDEGECSSTPTAVATVLILLDLFVGSAIGFLIKKAKSPPFKEEHGDDDSEEKLKTAAEEVKDGNLSEKEENRDDLHKEKEKKKKHRDKEKQRESSRDKRKEGRSNDEHPNPVESRQSRKHKRKRHKKRDGDYGGD